MMASLSFPLYGASSAVLRALMITTSPTMRPLVLGDHPALASVRNWPVLGSTIRAYAFTRSKPTGMVHGSRCTLLSP